MDRRAVSNEWYFMVWLVFIIHSHSRYFYFGEVFDIAIANGLAAIKVVHAIPEFSLSGFDLMYITWARAKLCVINYTRTFHGQSFSQFLSLTSWHQTEHPGYFFRSAARFTVDRRRDATSILNANTDTLNQLSLAHFPKVSWAHCENPFYISCKLAILQRNNQNNMCCCFVINNI